MKQDGPSLESSSYLNVSLRYLGPWDPVTPGPWNQGTIYIFKETIVKHYKFLPHKTMK